MNGLASTTCPVSASRMRMPSCAVSNNRRYRSSEAWIANSPRASACFVRVFARSVRSLAFCVPASALHRDRCSAPHEKGDAEDEGDIDRNQPRHQIALDSYLRSKNTFSQREQTVLLRRHGVHLRPNFINQLRPVARLHHLDGIRNISLLRQGQGLGRRR